MSDRYYFREFLGKAITLSPTDLQGRVARIQFAPLCRPLRKRDEALPTLRDRSK